MPVLIRLFGFFASSLPAHLVTGATGENRAARYLRRHGMRILGRNVHVGKKDEIDIVAYDPIDKVVVFAEVKTRAHHNDDYAADLNITPDKKGNMTRAARRWIREHDFHGGYRMDVLLVEDGRVTDHYEEIAWD